MQLSLQTQSLLSIHNCKVLLCLSLHLNCRVLHWITLYINQGSFHDPPLLLSLLLVPPVEFPYLCVLVIPSLMAHELYYVRPSRVSFELSWAHAHTFSSAGDLCFIDCSPELLTESRCLVLADIHQLSAEKLKPLKMAQETEMPPKARWGGRLSCGNWVGRTPTRNLYL